MTRSSCSVPALHLPVSACWETLRYTTPIVTAALYGYTALFFTGWTCSPDNFSQTESSILCVFMANFVFFLLNIEYVSLANSALGDTRKRCETCFKKITLLSGMCAELPPGAFRVSGGLHRRGRSQRVLLPQSPDLTCGRVILQRLRWQRSLTVYGQITSLLLQLVDQ